MPHSITFTAFSQRGTHKPNNEDAVLLNGQVFQGRVREQGVVDDTAKPIYFAIADGVSISTRPRAASQRLLELLQAHLASAPSAALLSALLQELQQNYATLGAQAELHGMASTLVGLRLVGDVLTVFNVGDSRAYLLSDAATGPAIRLLSRDHCVLNDMLDDGDITPVQSETAASFMRGLTSQFIADPACDDFRVNVVHHTWQPGERLVLCSDGLNEVLSDAAIAALLEGNDAQDLLNACKASRRAGGTDDFSVIVLARVV
jgi:protein phosphatase